MKKILNLSLLAMLVLNSAVSFAVPPATSPYMTDPQSEYVQDSTSNAINTVNMILCIVKGMNIADSGMLNKGAYVALIDMNKCQGSSGGSGGSSTAAGASASVNYMNAIVNAVRANDTVPMTADVWMLTTEQGKKQDIYVKLTATSAPTAANPYGVFRLDFMGKDPLTGATQMNGFIDSAAGSLQYFETGVNSSNIALNMSASLTSGLGIISIPVGPNNPTAVTYNFNFNPTNFRRSDGTNDQCFDRLKVNAKRSVWRYGTYDATTGARVDQPNPSFQVTASYAGASYYGYASYWGIGFQGLDLNTIADANPVPGLVVSDQRPNNTSTYTLSKVKGKLTKWTKVASTLAALDGIPVNFYGNLTGLTVGNTALGWGNWQIVWNNALATFAVTGSQTCGPTGCTFTPIAPAATATLNAVSISGWADSFGGNLNIPATAGPAHVGTDPISYFSQSVVIPGSAGAPTSLSCLNNCPDATSIALANVAAAGAVVVPFNPLTTTQWNSGATVVSYTFAAGGLRDGVTSAPMIITNAAFFAPGTNYQWGVQSGRLFDAGVGAAATDKIATCVGIVGTSCEPVSPAAYYTWSTSPDQWNQTMWLTKAGTIVTFDPPQNIQYTVPTDVVGGPVVYGSWGGKTIQLQFNGFGNINGIPGNCVSPIDNKVVPCGPNTRYVPAFPIVDGATMMLGTTQLIIKALDAEVRLNNLGAVTATAPAVTTLAAVAACGTMPITTTLVPPTISMVHDVSAAPGPFSIGTTRPIVLNSVPKVIDGVKQY